MQVAHEKVVYVIEVTKIILNLFIFFLQKYFKRIKTLANKKPTNKTKISEQKKQQKRQFFARTNC